MISVVIPAYNEEKNIGKAIDSVLNQTYQNFEIIIVDDGSTDNTREIVQAFKDKRVKYIYQQNSGPSKARNTAIDIASGEYIAFLDADDIYMPNKLEISLQLLSEANAGMLYGSFILEPQGKESKLISFKERESTKYLVTLLTDPFNNIAFPSTVLVKKDLLLETGGFDQNLRIGEDWDLWLKIYPKTKVKCVDRPLTKRLTSKNSITRTIDFDFERKTHEKILYNFFRNNKEYEYLKNKAYAMIYYNQAARHFYKDNKRVSDKTFKYLVKCIILDPTILLNYFKITKFTMNVVFAWLFKMPA